MNISTMKWSDCRTKTFTM